MKYMDAAVRDVPVTVAPHAGAWIEMPSVKTISGLYSVAPHAGAWIEIKEA